MGFIKLSRPARAVLVSLGAVVITGCTTVVEKTTGWLSSGADVYAVTNGRVLRGTANFARDRRATLEMQAAEIPALRCFGALRYTATSSGTITLSCSDGQQVVLPFQELSPLSGTARGVGDKENFGLTYGLPAEKAAGYLGLPEDRLVPPKATPAADSNRSVGGG